MTLWIAIDGKVRRVELPAGLKTADGVAMDCTVDGRAFRVDAQTLGPEVMSLVFDGGRQVRCVLDAGPEVDAVIVDGRRVNFEVHDPRSLRGRGGAGATADGPKVVKAPMPGRVVRVLVAVGDQVEAAQGLVVIEAMKMQNELRSPKAGRVVRMAATEGETVQAGAVLVVVE